MLRFALGLGWMRLGDMPLQVSRDFLYIEPSSRVCENPPKSNGELNDLMKGISDMADVNAGEFWTRGGEFGETVSP